MKYLLLATLSIVLSTPSFAQKKSEIEKAADAAVKSFTWDLQQEARGTLMFLDVPYKRDNSDVSEVMTLTVAKDKSKKRPEFISVIIPSNVVQSNGIFIKFSKTVTKNGERSMELENAEPVRVLFEKCDNEVCKARMLDGYATEEDGKKVDIFQKFLDFNHVLFLFVYPDGSHKSLAVPLFSFKEQYRKL
jgi:hypothetical protein